MHLLYWELMDNVHGLLQTVSSVEWHRKGDYFTTIVPGDILWLVATIFLGDIVVFFLFFTRLL